MLVLSPAARLPEAAVVLPTVQSYCVRTTMSSLRCWGQRQVSEATVNAFDMLKVSLTCWSL